MQARRAQTQNNDSLVAVGAVAAALSGRYTGAVGTLYPLLFFPSSLLPLCCSSLSISFFLINLFFLLLPLSFYPCLSPPSFIRSCLLSCLFSKKSFPFSCMSTLFLHTVPSSSSHPTSVRLIAPRSHSQRRKQHLTTPTAFAIQEYSPPIVLRSFSFFDAL